MSSPSRSLIHVSQNHETSRLLARNVELNGQAGISRATAVARRRRARGAVEPAWRDRVEPGDILVSFSSLVSLVGGPPFLCAPRPLTRPLWTLSLPPPAPLFSSGPYILPLRWAFFDARYCFRSNITSLPAIPPPRIPPWDSSTTSRREEPSPSRPRSHRSAK